MTHTILDSTDDLDRRIGEHHKGKFKYTKSLRPLKHVFKQEYTSLQKARSIENKLKKLKNKEIIERIIKKKLLKLSHNLKVGRVAQW